MFDIGAIELLVVAVVAIIVIGPKDMPQAMRLAGRWIGKLRRASAQFRSGFDALVREAEMEDMEKKWKERNARIMADGHVEEDIVQMEPLVANPPPSATDSDETRMKSSDKAIDDRIADAEEPMLPLDKSDKS